ITPEVLKNEFGETISSLVDGVTKVNMLQKAEKTDMQAETYRKMLLSMAKDIRVVIIKFADRLHNLRTLRYLDPTKIKKISQETMEVYAPLAHRLGMGKIKWELEDLAFKYLEPKAYDEILKRIVNGRKERETYIESFKVPLEEKLKYENIPAKIIGRPKHIYSIYRKMETRKKSFEDIYDLLAIRIITDTTSHIYQILGIVHSMWMPIQSRFKDFISIPKSNLYQSLHTTVIGNKGHIIEIQIRTEEMDHVAENGIAAHWSYKNNGVITPLDKKLNWLKQVIDWQKDLSNSKEFMEFFKIDLFHSEIFVFTPKGKLIQLPKGSTVLDFAFAVHSDLGRQCIAGRVDDKIVPMDTVLKSGATIEILKVNFQRPSPSWLKHVKTSKAKGLIRHWLRDEAEKQSISLGKELFSRELLKYRNQDGEIDNYTEKDFTNVLEEFHFKNSDELYAAIGRGDLPAENALVKFLPKTFQKKKLTQQLPVFF
ncbi:MAG: RelA/SpoT family protein, partial [Elusimicrobiota bacterium]